MSNCIRRNVLLCLIGFTVFGCAPKTAPSAGADGNALSRKEQKEGYVLLFDGQSLNNWIDANNQYEVRENAIVKKTKGYGNLYSRNEYRDCILRFEFLLTPAANNGLGFHHKLVEGTKGYDGIELQILDNDAAVYKALKPYQYHGSLYGYVPAKRKGLKPAGTWNYQEVTVQGSKIKIVLNGETILDTDIQALPAAARAKDPRLLYEKGHIAFLGHDSEIRIRNIRVREL
ncbi:DUF1080 domain-containing protein [Niabella pedocola]|uniref:DUF1080 domain-containing protein n=1 Tax=Niabella pedocola TaxID=1752077 RepID=A0ABS8PM57_9BACT|nr:DUF1080 domain-containing protein [Niabella pedocola]MCD2422187.1 DUF1080 domain-containing protein [Niabella pedocola]